MDIKLASKYNLHIIHNLANLIWPISYKEIISSEQISFMLNRMYAMNVLESNFDDGQEFYIAYKDKNPVGFMALEFDFEDKNTVKLQKLYVLPELHGEGIGKQLVDKAKEVCMNRSYRKMALNVNKQNKAFQFYLKQNFKVEKEEVFDIGNGFVMDDYIMVYKFN